jgi:hypothetical protein
MQWGVSLDNLVQLVGEYSAEGLEELQGTVLRRGCRMKSAGQELFRSHIFKKQLKFTSNIIGFRASRLQQAYKVIFVVKMMAIGTP